MYNFSRGVNFANDSDVAILFLWISRYHLLRGQQVDRENSDNYAPQNCTHSV